MHAFTRGLHSAPQDRNFTTVSRDRHARSYERVALSTTRSQFYHSFARPARTILWKGCTQQHEIGNFTTVSRDRHERSYERVALSSTRSQFHHSFARRQAWSYERVAFSRTRSQFYHSFGRSTCTILRKVCTQQHEIGNFTTVSRDRHAGFYERVALSSKRSQFYQQFRAIDTYDLTKGMHFRKHFPDHGAPPIISKVKIM